MLLATKKIWIRLFRVIQRVSWLKTEDTEKSTVAAGFFFGRSIWLSGLLRLFSSQERQPKCLVGKGGEHGSDFNVVSCANKAGAGLAPKCASMPPLSTTQPPRRGLNHDLAPWPGSCGSWLITAILGHWVLQHHSRFFQAHGNNVSSLFLCFSLLQTVSCARPSTTFDGVSGCPWLLS